MAAVHPRHPHRAAANAFHMSSTTASSKLDVEDVLLACTRSVTCFSVARSPGRHSSSRISCSRSLDSSRRITWPLIAVHSTRRLSSRSTITCMLSHHSNHSAHSASCRKVVADPKTTRPRRARVSITFSLRQSLRKPSWPLRLQRTAENKISSFSRP